MDDRFAALESLCCDLVAFLAIVDDGSGVFVVSGLMRKEEKEERKKKKEEKAGAREKGKKEKRPIKPDGVRKKVKKIQKKVPPLPDREFVSAWTGLLELTSNSHANWSRWSPFSRPPPCTSGATFLYDLHLQVPIHIKRTASILV